MNTIKWLIRYLVNRNDSRFIWEKYDTLNGLFVFVGTWEVLTTAAVDRLSELSGR
jgi:hypothetical protein